jgi:hypothetical protein
MAKTAPVRRYYVQYQDGTIRPVNASSKEDAVSQFMKLYKPPKGTWVKVRPQVPWNNETGAWTQYIIQSGPATLEESNLVRKPRRDSRAMQEAAAQQQGRRVAHARGVLQPLNQQVYPPQPQAPVVIVQQPGYPPGYPQMYAPIPQQAPTPPDVQDMSRRVRPARGRTTGEYAPVPQAAPAPGPAPEVSPGVQYGPAYPAITLPQIWPTGPSTAGPQLPYTQEQLAMILRGEKPPEVELPTDPREIAKIVEEAVRLTIENLKRRR